MKNYKNKLNFHRHSNVLVKNSTSPEHQCLHVIAHFEIILDDSQNDIDDDEDEKSELYQFNFSISETVGHEY